MTVADPDFFAVMRPVLLTYATDGFDEENVTFSLNSSISLYRICNRIFVPGLTVFFSQEEGVFKGRFKFLVPADTGMEIMANKKKPSRLLRKMPLFIFSSSITPQFRLNLMQVFYNVFLFLV